MNVAGQTARSGNAGWYGKYMFNFISNRQTVFQNGYMSNLHSSPPATSESSSVTRLLLSTNF